MQDDIDSLAAEIERKLPRMMRRLFTLSINEPAGELPVAQSRLCSHLLSVGASPITEIAEELGVTASAACQIADRLEKIGFVQRDPGLQDRRVRYLSLTEHGRALMTARRDRRTARVAQVLSSLPSARRTEIADAINALLNAATEQPTPDNPGRQTPPAEEKQP
ncbi:MAG: MarR family winged helix-turn-helix transcriptional regulator [Capsulimonadaceae bacterium]|nr:MarR family winged helix-turn-helix transcriptional regulator [Capsulimonadaceae bacterium]